MNNLNKARYEATEALWKVYWSQYQKDYPDCDGADYADEREAFFEEHGIEERKF